jgi:hypothetical protein
MMDDLARELGLAAPEMLKNETRLLSLELIRRTPPNTKDQGEKAIKRDLSKLFNGVDIGFLDRVGSDFGTGPIGHWITFTNGTRMFLQWNKLDPTGTGMSAFHRHNRDFKGHVSGLVQRIDFNNKTWNARYVVSKEDLDAYRTTVVNRAGFLKSGWLPGLIGSSGGTRGVGGWITRHLNKKWGTFRADLNNPQKAQITISNGAPGVRLTQHIVDGAIKTRQRALERRLRRALSGIIDDVTMGRRIRKINTVTT